MIQYGKHEKKFSTHKIMYVKKIEEKKPGDSKI